MQIGIFAGALPSGGDDAVTALVAAVGEAHEQGFPSFWTAQVFDIDALTALAVAGSRVPDIRLGTSVVPTYPRHPMALAQQALTVQAATGGRLRLGIGLSHQPVVEGMWGYSFDAPLRHLGEYLDALLGHLAGDEVRVSGQVVTSRGKVAVAGAEAPPVLIAALGPQMLALAGRRTAGTITWMVGPRTLATHTVPTIAAAAEEAGRPRPEVVAGMPICVTDDLDAARALAARLFAIYGQLPSYRAMLDREGLSGPEDLALIGDEASVSARLDELAAAGVSELAASEFGTNDEDRQRTRALLVERQSR